MICVLVCLTPMQNKYGVRAQKQCDQLVNNTCTSVCAPLPSIERLAYGQFSKAQSGQMGPAPGRL